MSLGNQSVEVERGAWEDGEDRFSWACLPLGSGEDLPILARFLLNPRTPFPHTIPTSLNSDLALLGLDSEHGASRQ